MMSSERELCGDDLVVASGKERLHYAEALLEMATLCLGAKPAGAAQLAAAGNSPSEFELRIERLMEARPQAQLRLSRTGLCVMFASFTLLLAAPGVFGTAADEATSNAANRCSSHKNQNATTIQRRATRKQRP
ncbi:MAG: hypothetical protein WD894_01270 [Pirellulales bacterium]